MSQLSLSSQSSSASSDLESTKEAALIGKTLLQAKQEVNNVLDQLVRIAFTIRQSGTRARLQKADGWKSSKHEGDLQRFKDHLTALVLATTRPLSKITDFPRYAREAELSEIETRLIDCNLKRRNRFLYQQTHASELADDQLKSIEALPNLKKAEVDLKQFPTSTGATQPQLTKTTSSAKDHGVAKGKNLVGPPKTDTTATALSAHGEIPAVVPPSVQAATLLSVTVRKASYPPAPKLGKRETFKCPCCCLQLSAIHAEPSRWK